MLWRMTSQHIIPPRVVIKYWRCAMRKCNSFRCISQLTRETADFGKSHALSHLQMRRRSIGSNTVSGIALILRTQKNFRVTCILWKTWHPFPARLCRPSPLIQGDLKQALTFPLSFYIIGATKHIFHSDSGSPTKTRQETAGRTTSTSTVVRSSRFPVSGNNLQPADS